MSVICGNEVRESHNWGIPEAMTQSNEQGIKQGFFRRECINPKCRARSDTVDYPESK